MPEQVRLVFFGSGEFGLPTLEGLHKAGHDIAAVVSQPDRPAGRGGKTRATPISEMAEQFGLPLLRPETPNTDEFAATLRDLCPDVAVVVAYGHLIKKPLLTIPRLGFVNLHASLLPAYRGAAPVPWAILSGESVSGCSVFVLDEKFDTGAVIATVSLPIEADDTSGSYLAKLAPLGGQCMVDAIAGLAMGKITPQPQDNSRASKAPKFHKQDGRIDWSAPFADIDRQVRAFQPWPQAYAFFQTAKGQVRINVLSLTKTDLSSQAQPGTVLSADGKSGLIVMAGDGPVRLVHIQPEGKRAMADTDFVRGTRIES